MQALCISRAPGFLCRGVVMECMVRLVRLGVGGNFFHTLEPKTFFVGSVFVLTSFITIPSAKEHRCHRLSPCFHGFHRVFQFRLLSSLPASSFETSFQFPFSSFHSFVSTSNQIGSPSSPNFPIMIFIRLRRSHLQVREGSTKCHFLNTTQFCHR